MSEKPWKRNERRIADLLGGRRVPITGRARGDVPDIDHAAFSIECKRHDRDMVVLRLGDFLSMFPCGGKAGEQA